MSSTLEVRERCTIMFQMDTKIPQIYKFTILRPVDIRYVGRFESHRL